MSEKEQFIIPETEPKIIRLDDVIDSNREVPEKYQVAIRYEERRRERFGTRHSAGAGEQVWDRVRTGGYEKDQPEKKEAFKEVGRYLANKLKGHCLVDLGGGYPNYRMRWLAAFCGVRTHINVDIDERIGEFTTDKEPNPLAPVFEQKEKGVREIGVRADMLDFVSRLKDSSVNFVINGIDSVIISENSDYNSALAQEMVRATRPDGLIFGSQSDLIFEEIEKLDPKVHKIIRKKDFDKLFYDGRIFEKKEEKAKEKKA